MNKYTLTFFHKDLEEQYQNTRLRMRNIIFFVIAFFYTVLNISCLILSFFNNSQREQNVDISIIVCILVLTICNLIKQDKICYWLSILNITGCFIQFNLIHHFSHQEVYLLGGNMMVSHMIILQKTDFFQGSIQIFFIFSIRLMLQALLENVDYYSISFSIMLSLFLIFVLFRTDQNRRKQFLLTLKDNHWDLYLSKMINKPFFYFEYDHTSFQLKRTNFINDLPIYNNEICEGCNLRKFLREYTYLDQTLEQYLLKRAKGRVPLIQNFEMVCHNKKKGKLYITFTELFSDAHDYIMTIDSSQQNKNMVCFKQYKIFKQYLIQYTKDLIKVLTFHQQKDRIIYLNVNYLSILFYQNYQISKYKPKNVLQTILRLFNNKKNLIELIQEQDQKYEIQGYKYLFITVWLQILVIILLVNKYGKNKIIIEQTEYHIKFTINIENKSLFKLLYKQNKFIQKIGKDLFCDEDSENLSMKIHKDLDISYINRNLY